MPIMVRVVSDEKYAEWLAGAKKKFASNGNIPLNVADITVSTQVQN